jgi:hypothetical protein
MTIKQIKKQMKDYRDFYGGELLNVSDIDSATTKKELAGIIETHRRHMEMMLCDAHSSLDEFKKKLGLFCI